MDVAALQNLPLTVLSLENAGSFTAEHLKAIAGIKTLKSLLVDARRKPAPTEALNQFKKLRPGVDVVVAGPDAKGPPISAGTKLSSLGAISVAKTDASEAADSVETDDGGAAPTAENFKRASEYSARNGGRAVLVLVDGKTVFEKYDNGFGPETATHLHSATKAFWGPVIAAMIEDGMIESFDELAAKTLTEWKDHPRKSRITLRHLLSLSAGLVQDVANLQGHDRPSLAPDLYRHAIGVPALREPGEVFQYGPSCYYVLGEIMKQKLAARKQTPLDYLKQRILDPIGVKVDDWVHDASGNPHIPSGA